MFNNNHNWLTEWAESLLKTLKSIDEVNIAKWLTKKDIARILNEKNNISDNSIASYYTIWQFKHIEEMLDELEKNELISIWWNTIFIK